MRSTLIDGEPWFVAADVCRALGLRADHTSKHLHRFQPEEINTLDRRLPPSDGGSAFDLWEPREYRLRIVSESGLYKLIMRSNKAEAQVLTKTRDSNTCLPEGLFRRQRHHHHPLHRD
ncbi:Bro-N domain-containing protein [Brevundimonas sp. SL130]|uniref:BRO-N domain-containing protein n=1 Tax=Brevundimonas sp. SL130 TaxID=2995143 RepID=UPI003B63AAD0